MDYLYEIASGTRPILYPPSDSLRMYRSNTGRLLARLG